LSLLWHAIVAAIDCRGDHMVIKPMQEFRKRGERARRLRYALQAGDVLNQDELGSVVTHKAAEMRKQRNPAVCCVAIEVLLGERLTRRAAAEQDGRLSLCADQSLKSIRPKASQIALQKVCLWEIGSESRGGIRVDVKAESDFHPRGLQARLQSCSQIFQNGID